MTIPALVASGVVGATSIALWYFGQRFSKRYVSLNGALPPLTWMFRGSPDAELEALRRRALMIAPFYLVAVAILLLRP